MIIGPDVPPGQSVGQVIPISNSTSFDLIVSLSPPFTLMAPLSVYLTEKQELWRKREKSGYSLVGKNINVY